MPFVTQILPQKRRLERYNVYLDGKYAFPVSETVLLDFGLKENVELSDEKIREIVEAENFQKFYGKVLDFLSYRIRSRDELVKRLREYLYKAKVEEDFSHQLESKILQKLEEANFINDEEFVKSYISSVASSKTPPGPRKIREFLYKKGVESSVVDKYLEEYSKESEFEGAKSVLEKKLKNVKTRGLKEKQKATQFLLRKGYSFDVVRAVVDSNFEV